MPAAEAVRELVAHQRGAVDALRKALIELAEAVIAEAGGTANLSERVNLALDDAEAKLEPEPSINAGAVSRGLDEEENDRG